MNDDEHMMTDADVIRQQTEGIWMRREAMMQDGTSRLPATKTGHRIMTPVLARELCDEQERKEQTE